MVLDSVIAISAFLSIALLAVWALRGVGGPVEARVRALGIGSSPEDRLDGAALPFQARVVAPLIESVGQKMAALLPGAFSNRTEHRLVLAGSPMRLTAFYVTMLVVAGMLATLYVLLVVAASDGVPSVAALLPAFFVGLIGMYLVTFWLSRQASARKKEMSRGLPDSMDLLTICVEAGLGLDAAFHRVSEKQSGPFVDELVQMLREIGLGKPRREALLDLADRTDLEEVRTFANAIIQAEQLGTSIARVLRAQADRLRVRRRQQAEQEARRAPVKMVFPLVFCLMPSLFIFILGPIVVNLIGYLSDA
jgi:tight adherence protein C